MTNTVVVTRASRYGSFRPYMLRASGGFSDVYVARDSTGQTAALKVYRSLSNDTSNSMERFRREKTILERIGSRRVARLIDADLEASPPWIASEFIEGPTLREAVGQSGRFSPEVVLGVLSLLAETLDELHSRGIAHRDLNPNNIILSKEGPTLIDFGSAQLAVGQEDFSRLSVGTPGYISPEQLNGEPATTASDVFAFGKIACFLLTGDSSADIRDVLSRLNETRAGILRRCLAADPRERPHSQDLRDGFAIGGDPITAIQQLEYDAPAMKRLPWGRSMTVVASLAVLAAVIGALGLWRATSLGETTTKDLVQELASDHAKYKSQNSASIRVRTRLGDYGFIGSIALPENADFRRNRRNYSARDSGFVDLFRLYQEDVVASELVIYTLPSVASLTFEELVGELSEPELIKLEGFGTDISDRVARFQSEFVVAGCPLEVPKRVVVDGALRRIRHVAAAPVCPDVLNTTQVAFAIHDWYPDQNLLFENTGWTDIAVLNPIHVADSIRLSQDVANVIARPTAPMTLPELSVHREGPSLINAVDEEYAFFYTNAFVEIPGRSSLTFEVSAPEDSPAHFSFTAYRQLSSDEESSEVPAGRLWATDTHRLRFDNPDTTPLVLSFEIDSEGVTPPSLVVRPGSDSPTNGWIRARALALGIGSASTVDSDFRFMLPLDLGADSRQTVMSTVGALQIPVPAKWRPTTSDDLASVGFREYWPKEDTELREADLPHLQLSTERFSRQVDGSDGAVWVADPAFLSCAAPATFTYTSLRTVEWSVFQSCEIPDALQSGQFVRQIQASMIVRFIVYGDIKNDRVENTAIFRGAMVPGTHQDLDYLRDLITYLAQADIDMAVNEPTS